MKVTVVVPAFNEEVSLPHCLEALSKQQTKYQFKVIVVNNASTDKTKLVANSWKNKLDLEVIDEPRKGRGSARAAGFSKAQTEITLSTDADSVIPPNWVEDLAASLMANPKAVAASGSSYITDGSKITNFTMKIGMPLSLRAYRLVMGHYMATGNSFAVRSEAYKKVGGFDVNRDMLDDIDLSIRLSKLGKILYLPHLKVETEGDIFRKSFIRGFMHYFRHFPALLKNRR